VRQFESGATRNVDTERDDPEAYMAPIVIERYCQFMSSNRVQDDGSVRDGDNWQKGIPLEVYMKGLWRHFLHAWTRHRGFRVMDKDAYDNIEEDLCAVIFGASGYLFEILKKKNHEVPFDIPNTIDNGRPVVDQDDLEQLLKHLERMGPAVRDGERWGERMSKLVRSLL